MRSEACAQRYIYIYTEYTYTCIVYAAKHGVYKVYCSRLPLPERQFEQREPCNRPSCAISTLRTSSLLAFRCGNTVKRLFKMFVGVSLYLLTLIYIYMYFLSYYECGSPEWRAMTSCSPVPVPFATRRSQDLTKYSHFCSVRLSRNSVLNSTGAVCE